MRLTCCTSYFLCRFGAFSLLRIINFGWDPLKFYFSFIYLYSYVSYCAWIFFHFWRKSFLSWELYVNFLSHAKTPIYLLVSSDKRLSCDFFFSLSFFFFSSYFIIGHIYFLYRVLPLRFLKLPLWLGVAEWNFCLNLHDKICELE